jgi:hypothetical protein
MELFNAPIPGQSLTDEPKNYPWENPPEINDPDEALAMHMSKFNDPEVIDNMLDLLDIGFPVRAMAESILTASVAAGWHSIDVSLIIAPAMYEHIISIANEAGVDYVEGFEEEEEAKQAKERERIRAKVAASLSKTPAAEQDEGYEMAMEALGVLDKPEEEYETLQQEGETPEEEPMMEEAETTEEAPQMQRGLMARG